MRALFIVMYAANLVLTGMLLRCVPARIPVHFTASGMPNAWHASGAGILSLVLLDTLLLAGILLAPLLLRRCPGRWFGIPNADYWLQAANRAEAERKLQARLLSFGTVTFLLLFLAGLCVLRSLTGPTLASPRWGLYGVAAGFVAYACYWYFAVSRDFRNVPSRD